MNLVTGATGIIGSHVLLALLQANRPVTACKQKNSDLKRVEKLFSYYTSDYTALFAKIKWIDLDIRDSFSVDDALEGIDTVYHCAGFVSFNRNQRKKLMEVNHQGTKLLVDACLHKNIKAFCHVSSMATINNQDYTLPLSEEVFWKLSGKESDYAMSKYNAEREVWRGMEEGLNAVIVNPGVVLSPGFWDQSSSRIFDTCYKGNLFYTAGSTGYVAARDVAAAMLKLVDAQKFSNRYILIENNYPFKTVFNWIHANFKKPLPRINATKPILYLGWMADSVISFVFGRKLVLTHSLINSALNKQLYSNHKINATGLLSFMPVEKCLAEICAIYLAEKEKGSIK
ncbi:MAG: NAD-dependent epimerase/dehydratase family protein [Bacteroidia bacterium]|nr:NAD-dependent epimerase/dehydratase family protein [Bacteroidia bacterium]